MADQAERLRELVRQLHRKEKDHAAKVVTVLSGKGGVGKTSFVVNFAVALARLGKRVVVIDADFGFSNVDIMLGANSKYNLGDVVSGERRLEEVIQTCDFGIRFISGGSGLEELINLSEDAARRLLEQLGQLDGEADIVLFDTGAGMRSSAMKIMGASDQSILIITPEPTSIMDGFVALKMSATIEPQPMVSAIINKAATEQDAKATYANFQSVVDKFLKYDLNVLGYICRDENMSKSISALSPLLIRHPSSTAAKQIQAIAQRFISSQEFNFSARGIRGFLNRIAKRGM